MNLRMIINVIASILLVLSSFWVGYWVQNKPAPKSTDETLFYASFAVGAAALCALILTNGMLYLPKQSV
jgi:hypothetical protein